MDSSSKTTIPVIDHRAIPTDDHEVRELRWRVKQLGQQCGRQGETIHRLRCELAEAREITGKIARGEVRSLERMVTTLLDDLGDATELIVELREKLAAAESVEPLGP